MIASVSIEWVCQIPCHLLGPIPIWSCRDARDLYTPSGQIDDEEHVETRESSECPHLDGQEVGGRDSSPMCSQELLPRRALASFRRRLNPMLFQSPPNRAPADLMPDVGEGALNPVYTPTAHSLAPYTQSASGSDP